MLAFCLVFISPVKGTAEVIVPSDGFADGWVKSGRLLRFVKNDLYGHINGGAELFHEFGFVELLVQQYSKGNDDIDLEIYQMENPRAAIGIYLTKCGREKPFKDITARNTGGPYQLTAVKGDCFVQVNNFSGDSSTMPAMTALARSCLQSIPEADSIALFNHLPGEGLITGSQLLVCGPFALQPVFTFGKGNVLQLSGKTCGVVGDYAGEDSSVVYTRIVIPYPDSATAESAYNNLVANLDPYLTVIEQWNDGFSFRDYRDKYGTATITGSVMEINVNLPRKPLSGPHDK